MKKISYFVGVIVSILSSLGNMVGAICELSSMSAAHTLDDTVIINQDVKSALISLLVFAIIVLICSVISLVFAILSFKGKVSQSCLNVSRILLAVSAGIILFGFETCTGLIMHNSFEIYQRNIDRFSSYNGSYYESLIKYY